MQITHVDSKINGMGLSVATVIRARGLGVLVERDGMKYRISRQDVLFPATA